MKAASPGLTERVWFVLFLAGGDFGPAADTRCRPPFCPGSGGLLGRQRAGLFLQGLVVELDAYKDGGGVEVGGLAET